MGGQKLTVRIWACLWVTAEVSDHFFLYYSSSMSQSWPEHPVLTRHSSLSSYASTRQPPQHSMSLDYGHHSPPLHHPHIHPAPNAHSSPRNSQRSCMARYALSHSSGQSFDEPDTSGVGYGTDCPGSSLLGNGGMDRNLLTSMDGQGQLQTPQVQPPLLPEKKRASEGEHSLGTASPAPSGFSSPHSGSSVSIPFPSILPDLSSLTPGTASPLPGKLQKPMATLVTLTNTYKWILARPVLLIIVCRCFLDVLAIKQLTVKFVQDTSKFWYKPDISRDQGTIHLLPWIINE